MENGEILDTLEEKIKSQLNKKRLSPSTRAQFEIQQLFLIYLRDDHKKVVTMWAVFRPMAWAMTIAAAAIIGLLISGRVQIALLP